MSLLEANYGSSKKRKLCYNVFFDLNMSQNIEKTMFLNSFLGDLKKQTLNEFRIKVFLKFLKF